MQGPYDVDGRDIHVQTFPKWEECVSLSALLFNFLVLCRWWAFLGVF